MYIEPIKELMSRCSESDQNSLVEQLQKLTAYVNRIIEEAPLLMRAGVNLEQQDYVEYAQRLYSARNRIHDIACEGVDSINQIAKRNHMREIFPDYTLEKANDPARSVVYNGETHRKVNQFCAIICNEFYHESSYTLEQYLMDKIAKQEKPYKPLSAEEVIKIGNEYEKTHNRLNVNDLLNQAQKDKLQLTCFDGTKVEICTDKDNIIGQCSRNRDGQIDIADCKITVKEQNSLTMGDMSLCIDKNGNGQDVPVFIISEFISRHGGIKEYEEIDCSKEKEQMQNQALIKDIKANFQRVEKSKSIYQHNVRSLQNYAKLIKAEREEAGSGIKDTSMTSALKLAMLSDLGKMLNEKSPEKLGKFFGISEEKAKEKILRDTPLYSMSIGYIPKKDHKDMLQIQVPGIDPISIDINEMFELSKEVLPEAEAEKFFENTQDLITNHAALVIQSPEQILDTHVSAAKRVFDGLELISIYENNIDPKTLMEDLNEITQSLDMVRFTNLEELEKIGKELPWAADRMKDVYLIATTADQMPSIQLHLEKIEKLNGQLLEAQQDGTMQKVFDKISREEEMLDKEYLSFMIKDLQKIYSDVETAKSVLTEAMGQFIKSDTQLQTLTERMDAVAKDLKDLNKTQTGQAFGDD